ncbi:MAG: hypothetical protein IJ683_07080 [Butyrivibrio sp.]|nr:hypothetical protein [Butyrivibrio sp.]MBR1642066.1 hypothetical protein [Butyrivibrio sp.]
MFSKENYTLLIKWLNIRNNNRSAAKYLARKGYKKIAIYGMADIGLLLYDELKSSDIEVLYAIDRNADFLNLDVDIDIKTPEDDFDKVDAIVIASITYAEEIKDVIKDKVSYPILTIEEVINDA